MSKAHYCLEAFSTEDVAISLLLLLVESIIASRATYTFFLRNRNNLDRVAWDSLKVL
jgi:hypothetical protein